MSIIRADSIKNRAGDGAPDFPNGITVTGIVTATTLNSTTNNVDVDDFISVGNNIHLGNAGVVTATTFVGNLTGNPTGTLQTAAQPNITSVGTLSSLNVSGNVSIGGTLTYEDVTNIDSVGLITARNGIIISGVTTVSGSIVDNSGTYLHLKTNAGEDMAKFQKDGGAFLYFNNNQKLVTDGSGVTVTGRVAATSYTGDGSALTGIDAAKIETGTTKVQTAATSIVNQVSGAGIATITAQGLNVTGFVTATSMTVLASGIDYQWQGGTATAWWRSEDIVSETSWPAAKGGTDANFINGQGGSNGISYIASDSLFNNHKSVSMSSGGAGSLRTSNQDQNRWWNNNDAFTMIMALQKDGHHSGSSLGDSAFAINYTTAGSGSNVGGWGFCPFGDHTWGGQYGEMFGYTGSQFENQFMMFSYPFRGLFMIRMGANFDYGELSVNGGHGWHPLEMRHAGPSSLPSNNYRSISILNNACENSSSHNFEGRVAECAWYKGKRLGGNELDTITKHWCNKFNL